MPKIDDLGVEFDDDVERALADPKSGVLQKVVDYFVRRKAKQEELARAEALKTEKKVGLFGGFLD